MTATPPHTGILLVNLGTPKSPSNKDVYHYLIEFLTDPLVIDLSWAKRQALVRGLIVPRRYRASARSYAQIWTEEGSPLLVYGKKVKRALQDKFGGNYLIELAMRYQVPSIKASLEALKNAGINNLLVFPLFPQYATATTGSVYLEVMKEIKKWEVIPEIKFVNNFATHPEFINALAHIGSRYMPERYDHVIFSFHGLPQRHIKKADRHGCCLKKQDCCKKLHKANQTCYAAQCHATAQGIIEALKIPEDKCTICFQSRLGRDPWLTPFTADVINKLGKENKKRVLVFSPAFVCDCLETLHEIAIEYKGEFIKHGGETLDLVEGLNAHPLWIDALHKMISDHIT